LAKEKAVEEKKVAEKKSKKEKAPKVEAAETAPVVAAPARKPDTAPRSEKIPKLAPKNKSRLPRRQKKAQKKAAGRL
jgi:hypothetical protein